MSIIIFLAAAAVAFIGYKRVLPLCFSGAAFLFFLGMKYDSGAGLFGSAAWLIHAGGVQMPATLAVIYAVVFVVFKVMGKKRPDTLSKDLDPTKMLNGMGLLVGRVLDSQSKSTVFTDVSIDRNVFGGLEANTSHEVQISHSTWLHDLNNDIDVHYAGSGELQVRSGHILGTMSWRGRSLIDINYSTGKVFAVPADSTNPIASAVQAGLMVLFGWAVFPLGLLLSPFVWMGWITWRGNGGFIMNALVPGSHRIEAIFIYGGAVAYAAFLLALKHNHDPNQLIPIWICLYVVLFIMHQLVARAIKVRHVALIAKGKEELNRLYEAAGAKHKARAAAKAEQDLDSTKTSQGISATSPQPTA